jgi:8-oxo-dGTP pyrophosphatase MutT (NUDIX family)
MSYLRHIQKCNLYRADRFLPFIVAGLQVGEVKHAFADQLAEISASFRRDTDALYWLPPANDFASRNQAMLELSKTLLAARLLPYCHGELYPVTTGQHEQPVFLMDRALVPYFGVRAFGQHMNGYIRRNGEIHMWIGRRSLHKHHEPGKLDNMVAGGFPWGLSLQENLAKECWEEAGIPAELAAQADATGHIAYRCETERGLKPDTMYCYDLELPDDFIPRCTDGEVDEFQLWPLERVAQQVRETDEVKLNCNLVIIDFLIRHGYIGTEHPEYADLITGLK